MQQNITKYIRTKQEEQIIAVKGESRLITKWDYKNNKDVTDRKKVTKFIVLVYIFK